MKTHRRRKNPQGPKPLVWRGYRNCDKCTRWRPVSDFTVYQTRTGYEQIKGTCEHCKREAERLRYEALSPEQKRKKGIKANKQAEKRRNDALHEIERLRNTLDRQNEKLEKQWDKLERGRRILSVRHGMNGTYVDITPFRMWLLRQHRLRKYNTNKLAEDMGHDASRVSRWLQGFEWNGTGRDPSPVRSIDAYIVDEIGVKMEDPGLLERLYPFADV